MESIRDQANEIMQSVDHSSPDAKIQFADAMISRIHDSVGFRATVDLIKSSAIAYAGVSSCKTSCTIILLDYDPKKEGAKCQVKDFINEIRIAKCFVEESLRGKNLHLAENEEEKRLAHNLHQSKNELDYIEFVIITNRNADETKDWPLQEIEFPANGVLSRLQLHVSIFWQGSSNLSVQNPGALQICLGIDVLEGAASTAILAEADFSESGSQGYKTFSFFVKGKLLRDIYDKYGGRLLESNVRDFLDSRNKVNAGILQTILKAPSHFLAFNNGIVCTSSKVDFEPIGSGSGRSVEWKTVGITNIINFQIINGGQTTSSLYFADKRKSADLEKVTVQAKLIEIPDGENGENFSAEIARFANSQSKVSSSDLMSNNQFQRDMERQSRLVLAKVTVKGTPVTIQWYYERTRGAYNNARNKERLAGAEKEFLKQHPLDKRFAKTDYAICEMAFRGRPYISCLGSQKCFEAFSQSLRMTGGGIIVDENYFQGAISKIIIFRETIKMFDVMARKAIDPEVRGSRAETVAYAVGLVSINSEFRINLASIFKNQEIGNRLRGLLKKALIEANKFLISEAAKAGNIPRTISQKEQTWEDFAQANQWSPLELDNEASMKPYFDPSFENEKERDWDSVRVFFLRDSRKFKELANITGRECTTSSAKETIRTWASKPFSTIQKAIRFPEMLDLMKSYIQFKDLVPPIGSVVVGSKFTITSGSGETVSKQLVSSPKNSWDPDRQMDLANPVASSIVHQSCGYQFTIDGNSWTITSVEP